MSLGDLIRECFEEGSIDYPGRYAPLIDRSVKPKILPQIKTEKRKELKCTCIEDIVTEGVECPECKKRGN